MARLLVNLPPAQWDRLCTLARTQYRDPRKQLELIVHKALAETLAEIDRDGQEDLHARQGASYAPTHVD